MRILRIALVCTIFLAGCWSPQNIVDRAIDKTVDKAAERVGQKVGDAIAADILANNPNLMYAYSMSVFQLMFYQGGYYIEYGKGYAPGQYTQYQSQGVTEGDWFEKVLLAEHANGNQWWRVETHSKQSDGTTDVVIMEALFSKPDETGTRRVLRMRAKLPGEDQPREIPITKQDSQRWRFAAHNQLTDESMKGMEKGVEKVETPAGTFQARHLQHAYGSDGVADWYLADEVPGGVVKFTRKYDAASDKTDHAVTLVGYGGGKTKSVLGVDLTSGSEPAAAPSGDAGQTPDAGQAPDAS